MSILLLPCISFYYIFQKKYSSNIDNHAYKFTDYLSHLTGIPSTTPLLLSSISLLDTTSAMLVVYEGVLVSVVTMDCWSSVYFISSLDDSPGVAVLTTLVLLDASVTSKPATNSIITCMYIHR